MNRESKFVLDQLTAPDQFTATVAAATKCWGESSETAAFTRTQLASAQLAGDLESKFESGVPTLEHPWDSLLSYSLDAVCWLEIANHILSDLSLPSDPDEEVDGEPVLPTAICNPGQLKR